MKNKKVLGILLSLALVLGVALPSTLAVSANTDGSESTFTIGESSTTEESADTSLVDSENNEVPPVTNSEPADDEKKDPVEVTDDVTPVCSCGTEDGVHTEGCPLYVAPADPTCSCGTEDGAHAEGCPLYVAPADPICSCGTEDGTHAEGCPLYAAPADPVCSCGAENGVHTEGCPLYVAPVIPALPESPIHIDTCVEGCTGENCECPCHELSLFERLMACTSMEEIDAVLAEATEEEKAALTEEEQMEIDAHIATLGQEELVIPMPNELPDDFEVLGSAVSFTNVAPFGDPVIGYAN